MNQPGDKQGEFIQKELLIACAAGMPQKLDEVFCGALRRALAFSSCAAITADFAIKPDADKGKAINRMLDKLDADDIAAVRWLMAASVEGAKGAPLPESEATIKGVHKFDGETRVVEQPASTEAFDAWYYRRWPNAEKDLKGEEAGVKHYMRLAWEAAQRSAPRSATEAHKEKA